MAVQYAVKLPHLSTGKIPLPALRPPRLICRAMEEDIAQRIKRRLKELNMSPRAASLKAGGSGDLLRGLLRGNQRSFRGEHLTGIASVLGVSVSWLLTGHDGFGESGEPLLDLVPVRGYVGAGAEAHYYEIASNPNDFVPMPPGGNTKTIAVAVRGTSLGEIFDGSLVYYDDVRDEPAPDMLRKLCVVGLADGRVLVKKLLKGSIAGRYHLASSTGEMIEDAQVEWAALVKWIKPK